MASEDVIFDSPHQDVRVKPVYAMCLGGTFCLLQLASTLFF